MSLPPANWYPNPDNAEQIRWWDGTQWSDRVEPIASSAVVVDKRSASAAAAAAKAQAKHDARLAKGAARAQKHNDRVAKHDVAVYSKALAEWQPRRDAQAGLLELANTFAGDTDTSVMLKTGEVVFATVTGASLIEDRAGQAQFVGHSQGFSVPVGSIGGHAVRYRVGAMKGHRVASPPVATAIDRGTVYVTNQRVIFEGGKQTRECLFTKLVSYQSSPAGTTVLSTSNRQKPTTISYGQASAGWFQFRLDLALAHFRGTVPELVTQLTSDLAAIDAEKPTAPAA